MTRYFDLHCDTATVLYDAGRPWKDANGHIRPRDLKAFEKVWQCFAVFLDDTRPGDRFSYLKRVYDSFFPVVCEPNLTPLFTVEGGGAAMDGELKNLDLLAAMGLKIFGLVWNGQNPLATGAVKDDDAGLTALGKRCCRRLGELDIPVDVSHLSQRGFWDATEENVRIVATHSNARALWDHPRNLTDEQIKEILRRKGLIGLNFCPAFLGPDPGVEDILRHGEHILELGGENGLAVGADLDGIVSTPLGIRGMESIPALAKALERRFGRAIAEKIMWGNALRCLQIEG